jgi:hypothetical protein
MKNIKKNTLIFLYMFFIIFILQCKKDSSKPLLSLLFNNKITVILKGTYASDRPLDFSEINNNQIFIDNNNTSTTETINNSSVPSYSDLAIFLDIGEIRVSTKAPLSNLSNITNQKDSEDFWDVLAPTRQVYCNKIYNTNTELNSCLKNNGFLNFNLLMNGTGVIYPSRDVGAGIYLHGGIFFRGLFTGYAKLGSTDYIGRFDNVQYPGADIMRLLNYDPDADSGTIAVLPPQLFPLHHITYPGTENVTIYAEYIPTIVEFRFNLKENLMLHSYQDSATGEYFTFVGISDWRKKHDAQVYSGGNLLVRMRMIYPSWSNKIRISGGTYTTRHYYALYYRDECRDGSCNKDNDLLPLAATPVRNGNDNILQDIMPGSYLLQCRYDDVYDGYPEKVLSEIPIEISGYNQTIDVNCTCGYSTTSGC